VSVCLALSALVLARQNKIMTVPHAIVGHILVFATYRYLITK
jgi:hypothetical protein